MAYLWGVYVVPERRGREIGRALVTEAIARARRWRDLEYLWLDYDEELVVLDLTSARRG